MGEHSTENQKKKLESFIKSQRDRLDEIDDLKKSSKTLNDDIFKLKKDLNLLTKDNKLKQKVNFILNNKNESLQTKIQKLKEEVTRLKKTKISLEKELKKALSNQAKGIIKTKIPDHKHATFNCKQCNLEFTNVEEVDKHIEISHNTEIFNNMTCDDCKVQNKLTCEHKKEEQTYVEPTQCMSKADKIKNL